MAGRVVAGITLIAIAACSGSAAPGGGGSGPIGTMAVAAGDTQMVLADSVAPIAPAVKITGSDGQPISGVNVTFTVPDYSGGEVSGATAATGSDGIARVGQWRVYGLAGSSTLLATAPGVSGIPVTFTATVLGRFRANAVNGTDHQSAAAGTAVAMAPAISVISLDDESDAGIPVAFTVIAGNGSVTSDTAYIAAGVATVGSWTLGATPGVNQLRAVILQPLGSDTVTFTATGT